MRSTPMLIEARPGQDYLVQVRFEDGLTAEVDLYSKEWSRVVSEGGIDGSQIGR